MGLKKELDKLKFDKRLTGYNLSRGKLKKDELEAHLKTLPDSADNVYNEEDDDLDNPGVFDDDDGGDMNDGAEMSEDSGGQNNSGF